ncbi:MAG: SPOR domain-containing protein [Candidatus Omnitrophica bacterium]|nr:SPOR domain-containing protein [Candidatus Omnitrophota bacterium]MBU1923945.1 SPOR domain-containing protein [Candidatus Omnitrophota bacterium]
MQKLKIGFIILTIFVFPVISWAANLETLKADFLQGNYRRVMFEAQAQVGRFNIQGTDELDYLLGLSYLKEDKLEQAQECFRRILSNPMSKFKAYAAMASGDVYLIKGQFQDAEVIYNKLLEDNPNTSLKAGILYRLSQSGYRKGNKQQFNEYLLKLKRDFPLSLELRSTKGIPQGEPLSSVIGEFSIQVGFFVKSLNAVNFKHKLLAMGYPVYVEGSSEGYRVKVGRFKTQVEALETENKLSQEGFSTKLCP